MNAFPRLTASALALGAFALSVAAPAPAAAQQNPGQICAKRDAIVERLKSKYGEDRVGFGLQRNNGVVEIFSSEETGTWTIVVTFPTGQTCLMAAGESWDNSPLDVGLLDDDA